jgi:hypothetical protein
MKSVAREEPNQLCLCNADLPAGKKVFAIAGSEKRKRGRSPLGIAQSSINDC